MTQLDVQDAAAATRVVHSYCRNCAANCGLALTVEDGSITGVAGDRGNLISEGYFCIKGTMAVDLHRGAENRLTQCLKRGDDGVFRPIDRLQAVDEIADRLADILRRRGPRALAAFFGTTSYSDCVGKPLLKSLLHELGSPAIFSSMTVDQSSKWVTAGRFGVWANGKPFHTQTDVVLIAGCNPLVSHQGYPMNPFPGMNPHQHVRTAKARGVKLIVIDVRRTELARHADLFIQPRPGFDAAIFAALVRLVLASGRLDGAFLERFTVGVDALRAAVAPFTPERVAAAAGIDPDQLRTAAAWLAEARKPGLGTGTGHNMAAFSNTAEHLAEALTALAGGYLRAGDEMPNPGVFVPRPEVETVLPPSRGWLEGPRCASDPRFGKIMGEFPASIFPDEVLCGEPDAIGALIVTGANPAMCLGDPERVRRALGELELLVTFDPRADSATAQLSHYILAPTLMFERAETTTFTEMVFHKPFIQYTPQVQTPPPQTIGEDEFVWRLARRLGVQLTLKNLPFGADFHQVPGGLPVDMEAMPPREALIAWLVSQTPVAFEALAAAPQGLVLDTRKRIGAPPEDDGARLDLCPEDVAAEVRQVDEALDAAEDGGFPYRLTSRRITEAFNSSFRGAEITLRRHGVNRLCLHPLDAEALRLAEDQAVRIASAHGEVVGYARLDASMRPGVVSMTHCWGSGARADPLGLEGAHTGALVSLTEQVQPINRMPLQSGVPVRLEPLPFGWEEARAAASTGLPPGGEAVDLLLHRREPAGLS